MGVIVEAGVVREGTPICVPTKDVSCFQLKIVKSHSIRIRNHKKETFKFFVERQRRRRSIV